MDEYCRLNIFYRNIFFVPFIALRHKMSEPVSQETEMQGGRRIDADPLRDCCRRDVLESRQVAGVHFVETGNDLEVAAIYIWRKRRGRISADTQHPRISRVPERQQRLQDAFDLRHRDPLRFMQEQEIHVVKSEQIQATKEAFAHSLRRIIQPGVKGGLRSQPSDLGAYKRAVALPFVNRPAEEPLGVTVRGRRIKSADALFKGVEDTIDAFLLVDLTPNPAQAGCAANQPAARARKVALIYISLVGWR